MPETKYENVGLTRCSLGQTRLPIWQTDNIPRKSHFEAGISDDRKMLFYVVVVVDQYDAPLDRRGIADVREADVDGRRTACRELAVVEDRSTGEVLV